LPFLTVLAPSERDYEGRLRLHKKLTDWASQMGKQVRRWRPKRTLILVADSSYAALELLDSLLNIPEPVYKVTHLRWDAALYERTGPGNDGLAAQERGSPAHLSGSARHPGDGLANDHGAKLVWSGSHPGRTHQCHGCLVPLGDVDRAPALGVGARHARPV
jgi:hypothetical protein